MPQDQAERKQGATGRGAKTLASAERVGRRDFRDRQRELLDAATHRDATFVITEYGDLQVVVMSVRQFRQLTGVDAA